MADEAFENFDEEAAAPQEMDDAVQDDQAAQVYEEAPVVQTAELPEIKLFGRWSSDDIDISDISVSVSVAASCNHVFHMPP